MTEAGASTVDAAEVARFAALAETWWDPRGPMRPLHALNPVRIAYLRDAIAARFARDATMPRPLSGLTVLDIGCGGGLLCEPLSRLGARVVGIDAGAEAIAVARAHAAESDLEIDYRETTAEALAAGEARFDAVLAMEIVEHVADLDAFVAAAAALVAPGGILVMATLNRTAQALALAVVGAEYLLGWLPRGTHDWRRFVRPAELARRLRRAGLTVGDAVGVRYRPLTADWGLGRDLSANYMMTATRPRCASPLSRRGGEAREGGRR